jgi:hypothetical protein
VGLMRVWLKLGVRREFVPSTSDVRRLVLVCMVLLSEVLSSQAESSAGPSIKENPVLQSPTRASALPLVGFIEGTGTNQSSSSGNTSIIGSAGQAINEVQMARAGGPSDKPAKRPRKEPPITRPAVKWYEDFVAREDVPQLVGTFTMGLAGFVVLMWNVANFREEAQKTTKQKQRRAYRNLKALWRGGGEG